MFKKTCIYCLIIIPISFCNHLFAFNGNYKRSCNNNFKTCVLSKNILNSQPAFVGQKLTAGVELDQVIDDKNLSLYMNLPEKSKIDSRKVFYSNKEAYIAVVYSINGLGKKYEKEERWFDVCMERRQICIKKC